MKKLAPLGTTLLLLLASTPGLFAQGFGSSVAIGDGEILIAEPLGERIAGTVYVYNRSADGGWREAGRLVASDARPGDQFGQALALAGNSLLIGTTEADSSAGAVYVFARSPAGVWQQTARLQPAELAPGEAFGQRIASDGDVALVSAIGQDEEAGAVYVFRRDGSTGGWHEEARLVGDDTEADDAFGASLAIAGPQVLIGAPNHDKRQGAVYLFRHDSETGGWTQEAKLQHDGAKANDRFGSAVLGRGEEIFVGAMGRNRMAGAVYRFTPDEGSGEWSEGNPLTAFDPSPFAMFGASLIGTDAGLWVGAPGAEQRAGRAYLFELDAERGEWTTVRKLAFHDIESGDGLGLALAVRGDVAVAGVAGDDGGFGTAVIFERGASGWNGGSKVWSEIEGLDPIVGGEVMCAEETADQFSCRDVDLIAFLPNSAIGGARGVRLNDVWGWTDPESGRDYAIVGRADGTAFVEVSDPIRPVYVGELPMTEGATANRWRDMKVYRDHVFIVADGAGEHGMQVFDLTLLREYRGTPITFTETGHYDQVASVHNIVINEETGFAFAVGTSSGGETCGGGLHMIDIRTPDRPTFAGCFADPATGRRQTGYVHDAQCVIYSGPDTEHQGREICFGANETAISIADVTDKQQPVAVSTADYPNVGYAHQGWLTDDQRYFFLDDETDEVNGLVEHTRTLVWDVTDLDDPVLLTEYFAPTRATDHNLYVKGDRMYQSNNRSGLRVVDISDPAAPVEIGFFDTTPWSKDEAGFDGTWSVYPFFDSGVILLTSRLEGLFLVRPREPQLVP